MMEETHEDSQAFPNQWKTLPHVHDCGTPVCYVQIDNVFWGH